MFEDIKTKYFPTELIPGITAKSDKMELMPQIWDKLAAKIFSPLTELGNYALPEARRERAKRLHEVYKTIHQENITFYNEKNEPIGWSFGVMIDPCTFFMSWSGILPAYQRQGIYTTFLKMFLPYLNELGYERVTSNHMVNNRAVLIAKLKVGFYVTGVDLDERFGAQVNLAYLFAEDRRQGFARAFSLERYADTSVYS